MLKAHCSILSNASISTGSIIKVQRLLMRVLLDRAQKLAYWVFLDVVREVAPKLILRNKMMLDEPTSLERCAVDYEPRPTIDLWRTMPFCGSRCSRPLGAISTT